MEAPHALTRAASSPGGMAPNPSIHSQLQQSLPHHDGSNIMYSNDGPSDLTTNGHLQMTPASHQTEELYKRSVMIIIWYKAHTAPLRLLQPLPTFPFLQLSAYPTIVASLSLNENSFVDAYNAENGQWEQHTINTVRLAETEQRFLYRLRKSLLEGLSEDECPGIAEEIARQPHPGQMGSQRSVVAGGTLNGSLKRSAPDSDSPQAAKYYLADIYRGPSQGYPVPVAPPQSYPQNLSAPKEQTIQISTSPPSQHLQSPVANGHQHRSTNATKQQGPYLYQQSGLYAASSSVPSTPTQVGAHAASPPATSPVSAEALPAHLHTPPAPIPYHPHPPLKRWPNDYTVSEVATGFKQMDSLIAQMPTITQRAAFERVFGCRYVKSTVCRHRGVWRRAREDVRAAFEGMGRDERAVWGEFVRRVEGRASALQPAHAELGAGAQQPQEAQNTVAMVHGHSHHMQGTMMGQVQGMVSVAAHLMRREEEEGPEEAVMGSLGPPPPEHEHHMQHQHPHQHHQQHQPVHQPAQQQQQQQQQHPGANGHSAQTGMAMNGSSVPPGQPGEPSPSTHALPPQAGPNAHVPVYDPSLTNALGGDQA